MLISDRGGKPTRPLSSKIQCGLPRDELVSSIVIKTIFSGGEAVVCPQDSRAEAT